MSCCFCCPVRCGFRSDNENTGGYIQICHLLGWRARIGRPATDDAQLSARGPHLLLAVEDVHGVVVSVPQAAPMRTLTVALVCMPVLAFAFLDAKAGLRLSISSVSCDSAVSRVICPRSTFPLPRLWQSQLQTRIPGKHMPLPFHACHCSVVIAWLHTMHRCGGAIIVTCRHEIETTCPSRNKMAMIICWMLLLLLPQARVLILDSLSFLYV